MKLIRKTVTLSRANYDYVMNSPGINFSDKLRRLLDEFEKKSGGE